MHIELARCLKAYSRCEEMEAGIAVGYTRLNADDLKLLCGKHWLNDKVKLTLLVDNLLQYWVNDKVHCTNYNV